MDLIRELGPSGSDNDDEEQEIGLIIIPPQCHTPDSSSCAKTALARGSASTSDARDSIKSSLFRQSVKNKLKGYTVGRVSLPGSPIPSKIKKDRKLTKEENPIGENGTSVERSKKLLEISTAAKGESPIAAAVFADNVNTVGQVDVSFKSSIVDELIQDVELDAFSKKSVPKTSIIDRNESSLVKINIYPNSWSEIKEHEIDLDTLRDHMLNPINTDLKTTSDFRQQLLFKSPANLLNGLTCIGSENKPNQRIAPQYLRYTASEPRLVWSYNPIINPSLTRSEILEYIPSEQKDLLCKLFTINDSIKTSDKITCNNWYDKMALFPCENENNSKKVLPLSFTNKSSNDDVCELELTPKFTENQILMLDETKIAVKKIKKRKKKRSTSTTEDEEYCKKKRSKKRKKEKKSSKSKGSKISDKSKTKKIKHIEIPEELLKVESKKKKSAKKKEKYAEILSDEFDIPTKHQKSKKRSKSSGSVERKHKKKSSKGLKDLNTSPELKEQIDKSRSSSSKKNVQKSQDELSRKESSNSKPTETEPREESHTPKTEEYHSRWESDEELLKLERHAKKKYKHRRSTSGNMSWESDEENHHSRQKYSSHHHHQYHRSAAERSLEMPLNITHVSRHRVSTKYSDEDKHHRPDQHLYSEDSWERGEYLKIKNEREHIELQKGRHTLSEERRQLELEKQKIVEMEQRLAEQRYKHQQELELETVVVLDDPNAESKEKRYFENIGKETSQEESFVCDYHKEIIGSKQRKSRWEATKEESDLSVSIQTIEMQSPSPKLVSSSVVVIPNSPTAIDVDNYSPKTKPPSPEVPSVDVTVEEVKQANEELLEDIQLPTSTSNSIQPVLEQDIEKVVELENEYEQFMMSLTGTNEAVDAKDEEKEEVKVDELKEASEIRKVSSNSSGPTSESSSGSSSSSDSTSAVSMGKEAPTSVEIPKDLNISDTIINVEDETPITSIKRLVTSTNANRSLIINQKASPSNKPDSARYRVPIQILETIIIEDDDVPPIKLSKLPDLDLSNIQLPPQYTAPVPAVPLNFIELPPPTIETLTIPEDLPPIVEEPHYVPEIEEVDMVMSPEPSTEITSPVTIPVELVEVPTVTEAPKEDVALKRNNLISIKFLSPKKRALEMNSIITEGTSDGEEEKTRNEDCTANSKRLFSGLNEPPSPARLILPLETRPQLITVEQKAILDQMRRETLERNEKWEFERAVEILTAIKPLLPRAELKPVAKEREELKVEKPIVKEMKDLREVIKDIKDSKESRDSESVDHYRDREQDKRTDKQRKDSTNSDRRRSSEVSTRDSSSKRRPSKERDTGQSRKRSLSPAGKRRRASPPQSRSDRGKDRDRDKDRQRRLSPRRLDKDRDRRLDVKRRRSRSRSPAKSKIVDRRRSRDKSPKRRSGDRERDARDGRRPSPPRSRRRSPSPASKRRSGHRDRSRSPERKKERIEDTLKRLAGIETYNSTSSSTQHHTTTSSSNPSGNKSPRSSPLDGFKRSLADSTISDDQLLPTVTESPAKQSPKTEYFKSTSSYSTAYHTKHDHSVKPKLSPKRPSLDDRINQVLGIEKANEELEAPRRISTTYEGQYDYSNKYTYPQHQHTDYMSGYSALSGGEMNAESGSRLVQMGNVLQIVPAASTAPVESSRPRKEHSSSHHHQSQSSSLTQHHQQPTPQQQILQVGNMLQIVPTALLPSAPPTTVSCAILAAVAPPPPPPLPVEETATQQKVLSSAEELLRQQHAQRKAEKEVRRQERDKRRKEKERKQKEREKKKALRVKTKTEDMIKRALMLETEGNVEDDGSAETAGVAEEMVDEVKWSPSNPILAGALANLTKPVGKSILTSEKLSKLNVTKALELLTDSRKQVKFADGIIPGEGTSPSAGEELTSPPPSGKRALKEKRHTKSLLSKVVRNKLSKKKVKVKVVRNSKKHSSTSAARNPSNPASNPPNPLAQPLSPSPSDAELELLAPPSPPPGSPPPHIFPARVKPPPPPNNIHPSAAAAYLTPTMPGAPAHYPYAVGGAPVGMMYGVATPAVGPMGIVGGYVSAAPPPPPPLPAAIVAGGSVGGRYGGIPALPPTHQLPHHLALRAGASHKSRQ